MKNALYIIWEWIKNIPKNAVVVSCAILKNPNFHLCLKIWALLILILGVGPYVYLQYDWPYDLKPRNYFEFLNTGLLLFIVYRLMFKKE